MTLSLITPIVDNKPFLLKDTPLPQMANNDNKYSKTTADDDELSVDSWETLSNEDLDHLMEFSKPLLSPESHSESNETMSQVEFELLKDNLLVTTAKTLERTETKKAQHVEENAETRQVKREKNRMAARRCRQKQKDRIDYLEKDVKEIETANYQVENEIKLLQRQLRELRDMLVNHDCVMQAPRLTHYRSKYTQNFPPCW